MKVSDGADVGLACATNGSALLQRGCAEGAMTIAVVVPAYRVTGHVLGVLARMPDNVDLIYVVDDCCPDASGGLVEEHCRDARVRVLRHARNLGVGGAVMTGYRKAVADGAQVIIKIDGDGQMNPALIPYFIAPIISGDADYTKGNRFFDIDSVKAMPSIRLFGNAILSFITKLSSGYWNLFDPTNGYTAIHADVARLLPYEKISQRYFFESDMLFRLNTLRCVVFDVPMKAVYADEVSGLRVSRVLGEFIYKNSRNFVKRIFYNYYLRDFSVASIQLPIGLVLLVFGCVFGVRSWMAAIDTGETASAGTVMLSALPVIVGTQLLLGFLANDIASVPREAMQRRLSGIMSADGQV